MVESMIKHEQQSVHGMLPVWSMMGNENWCMSGYHAVSVLADAITKGVFSNVDEALAAMVSTSTVPYYEGVADYMKLGYIPLDKSGTAASSTLEYAYDDWTIYQTALKSGKKDIAETYRKRALNYRNIYDTTIGFAVPVIATVHSRKISMYCRPMARALLKGIPGTSLFTCRMTCLG